MQWRISDSFEMEAFIVIDFSPADFSPNVNLI